MPYEHKLQNNTSKKQVKSIQAIVNTDRSRVKTRRCIKFHQKLQPLDWTQEEKTDIRTEGQTRLDRFSKWFWSVNMSILRSRHFYTEYAGSGVYLNRSFPVICSWARRLWTRAAKNCRCLVSSFSALCDVKRNLNIQKKSLLFFLCINGNGTYMTLNQLFSLHFYL